MPVLRSLAVILLVCLLFARPAAAVRVEGVAFKVGGSYASPDFQFEGAEILEPSAVIQPSGTATLILSTSRRARFHLMPELTFLRKGFSLSDTDHLANVLSMPILLRSTVSRRETGLHIFFGPVFDFVLSHDEHVVLDAYRSVSLGGTAGMGYEARLSRQVNFLVEFRFSSEFTNVIGKEITIDVVDDNVGAEELISVKHRTLQLSVGARF